MVRIDARPFNNLVHFEIRREGELVLTTADAEEAITTLANLGVDDPRPLILGAAQWRAVEIGE